MKVWTQYGSEHSMNLVMIGSFKELADAEDAKKLIGRITEAMESEPSRSYEDDPKEVRYSNKMLDFLMKENLVTLGPVELEQFQQEVSVRQLGNQVIVTTEESEVSGYLKIMVEKGAKVEVYSAHNYPDTKAADGTDLGR